MKIPPRTWQNGLESRLGGSTSPARFGEWRGQCQARAQRYTCLEVESACRTARRPSMTLSQPQFRQPLWEVGRRGMSVSEVDQLMASCGTRAFVHVSAAHLATSFTGRLIFTENAKAVCCHDQLFPYTARVQGDQWRRTSDVFPDSKRFRRALQAEYIILQLKSSSTLIEGFGVAVCGNKVYRKNIL